MTDNEKGFTLLEVLVALSLFGILSLITISTPNRLYDRAVLTSTAMEVKSALQLSQQLSLDESREYCVEFIEDTFRVREYVVRGRVVLSRKFDKNISVYKASQSRISYNRHGETQYGKFILVNKKGEKIDIDTLIGTGKIRISDIY
ncbi:type II secretion system GspH family protein [Alkaliphilus sp. MSJ-5]|uniref:Type II secretion system GspH family protein n=1 Tax=Alkaliphilus flagellatus TaxID=2841507 RepID=A0ABS6G777_9FIRM|nr:type II secretion system protein [Alkaliphilus flagellatus]MBU5677582.1 type II secretion system GspH family protein [Alkaliphilus flagellatus]